jgi:hypothetical protein
MTPAQFWQIEMQNQQNQQEQQRYNQKMIVDGLAQLGGAVEQKQNAKSEFMGTYNFLQEKNLVSPELDETIQGFVKRGNYNAANAYIQPYLAELDFGRKSMLAGRSGFFDDGGNWQMAIVPEAVQPRNKSGYRVGGN